MSGTVARRAAIVLLCAALGGCATTSRQSAADSSTQSFVANALASYGIIAGAPVAQPRAAGAKSRTMAGNS